MKQYQLISLTTFARLFKYPDDSKGFPAVLKLPDDREPPVLDDGYKYVIVEDRPNIDSTIERIERQVTAEKYGWLVTPFTAEELAEKAKAQIPQTIRAWQAKAALEAQGYLPAIEAALDGMPDGVEKIAIKSAWANNADFSRDSVAIATLGAAIGLDATKLDELFTFADQLEI